MGHIPNSTGVITLLALFAADVASATTAADLCASTDDPCVVTEQISATPGSVIDLGNRALLLRGNASLLAQGGPLTLRAASVNIDSEALIRTSGRTRSDSAGTLTIDAAELTCTGTLDTRGSPPGAIEIITTDRLTISGTVRSRSESSDDTGATFSASGATISISGSLDLSGGRDDEGGSLSLSGGNITLDGEIDLSGGDGGTADLSATASFTLGESARIDTSARTSASDAGDISIASEGDVRIHGQLVADGRDGGEDGGGLGGTISISGDQRVIISATASLDVHGGGPDGLAGDIDVDSFFGNVTIAGPLDASTRERDGFGGAIDITAFTSLDVPSSLSALGGASGGLIDLTSFGSLAIARQAEIDASATRESSGGIISISATDSMLIGGTLRSRALRQNTGEGGSTTLSACTITVSTSATIDSSGPRGSNTLSSGGRITITGTLAAGPEGGKNELRHAAAGPTPSISGADIEPEATIIARSQIISCAESATATPTSTASPSPTATPTATMTPSPACPGDCNGNGRVQITELILAVNIALERTAPSACNAADTNGDGLVRIGELIQATASAISGCPQ